MLTAQDPLDTATELEQPLWRIARHTAIYPKEKRIAAEIPLARQDFMDMAAVMEKHMERREYLVGGAVTVADLVAAYTLDTRRSCSTGAELTRYTRDAHPTALVRSPKPGAESAHRPEDGATCLTDG